MWSFCTVEEASDEAEESVQGKDAAEERGKEETSES